MPTRGYPQQTKSSVSPMAIFEWVDDSVSFRIPTAQVAHYNRRQQQQQDTVINDGRTQKGGHLWFKGANWPDGTTEEFDNMSTAASTPSKSSHITSDVPFTYSLGHIDVVSEQLRIPWERSKDQSFGSSFTYIGFLWDIDDIDHKTVMLTEHKREKYHQAILEWD